MNWITFGVVVVTATDTSINRLQYESIDDLDAGNDRWIEM